MELGERIEFSFPESPAFQPSGMARASAIAYQVDPRQVIAKPLPSL
jgi:hypothetical protein